MVRILRTDFGVAFFEGEKYNSYGDSVHSRQTLMETPVQGANISSAQRENNQGNFTSHVSVEWVFIEVKKYWSRMEYKRSLLFRQAPYENFT